MKSKYMITLFQFSKLVLITSLLEEKLSYGWTMGVAGWAPV